MDFKKLFFEKNEGNIDRAVRIIIGIVLVYVFVLNMFLDWLNIFVLFAGLVLIVTGLVGHCSVYSLFGFSTKK